MRLTNAFFLRPAACCCCVMWDILVCDKNPKTPHNLAAKFGDKVNGII